MYRVDELRAGGSYLGRVLSRRNRGLVGELLRWSDRGFGVPIPAQVKRDVLLRYGGHADVWIETGTYLGDTTQFLADRFSRVYTIEPAPHLAERARQRFAKTANVVVLEGTSEAELPMLLPQVSGDVSFWLDGHFSETAVGTFKGASGTPIREELAAIAEHIERLGRFSVMVDDFGSFSPAESNEADYPAQTWLVGWAEDRGLRWTVEHDIFVTWNNR